jgi:hypothetical protein
MATDYYNAGFAAGFKDATRMSKSAQWKGINGKMYWIDPKTGKAGTAPASEMATMEPDAKLGDVDKYNKKDNRYGINQGGVIRDRRDGQTQTIVGNAKGTASTTTAPLPTGPRAAQDPDRKGYVIMGRKGDGGMNGQRFERGQGLSENFKKQQPVKPAPVVAASGSSADQAAANKQNYVNAMNHVAGGGSGSTTTKMAPDVDPNSNTRQGVALRQQNAQAAEEARVAAMPAQRKAEGEEWARNTANIGNVNNPNRRDRVQYHAPQGHQISPRARLLTNGDTLTPTRGDIFLSNGNTLVGSSGFSRAYSPGLRHGDVRRPGPYRSPMKSVAGNIFVKTPEYQSNYQAHANRRMSEMTEGAVKLPIGKPMRLPKGGTVKPTSGNISFTPPPPKLPMARPRSYLLNPEMSKATNGLVRPPTGGNRRM